VNVPVFETSFDSSESNSVRCGRAVEFDPAGASFRPAGRIGCAGRQTAVVDLTAEWDLLHPMFGLVRAARAVAAFPAFPRLLFPRIHGFVNWPRDD
jgi:hypothetical protein